MRYYPKRYDWLKMHKKRKISFRNGQLIRSRYGIVASSFGLITQRQFEALRRFIARRIRKKSKYFRRTSLSLITTKKSSKARMGKGIGKFHKWIGYIRPGLVIYEINEIIPRNTRKTIIEEFNYITTKLPFKCKLKVYDVKYKLS